MFLRVGFIYREKVDIPFAIRSLATTDEYHAAAELQRSVWGPTCEDEVPPFLMLISGKVGAVAAGAFLQGGQLIGLVYGFPGYYNDRFVYWSHLLAVVPEWRDHGIGLSLKEYQRSKVLERDVHHILWTFDPLESRNAHFNINRLGVSILAYERDLYGSGETSPLYSGLGTDRLIVDWNLDRYLAAKESELRQLSSYAGPYPSVPDAAALSESISGPQKIAIAIPDNIQELKKSDPVAARNARIESRRAFEWAFCNDYTVTGFVHGNRPDESRYILTASNTGSD